MTWSKKLKKPLILLVMTLSLSSCAGGGNYDGKTLIMAIPKGCEKQYVDFYKCEMSKTFWDWLLMKKCKAEPCE